MVSLTVTQLLQLYMPLAGLLGVTFWLGILTQTVRGLREDVDDLKGAGGPGGNGERFVRLEVNMENVTKSVSSIERSIAGIQRQLANGIRKPLHEFGSDT